MKLCSGVDAWFLYEDSGEPETVATHGLNKGGITEHHYRNHNGLIMLGMKCVTFLPRPAQTSPAQPG